MCVFVPPADRPAFTTHESDGRLEMGRLGCLGGAGGPWIERLGMNVSRRRSFRSLGFIAPP